MILLKNHFVKIDANSIVLKCILCIKKAFTEIRKLLVDDFAVGEIVKIVLAIVFADCVKY